MSSSSLSSFLLAGAEGDGSTHRGGAAAYDGATAAYDGAAAAYHKAPLSILADRLCAALQVEGKAAASVWQVRDLLRQHAHSAEAAVSAAPALVQRSPPRAAEALSALHIDELSAYEWLRRAGLEHHAHAFEDAGYATARHIYGLDADAFKDSCGIKDEKERKALVALANADEAHSRTLLAFTTPGYARVRQCFLAAFAGAGANSTEKSERSAQTEEEIEQLATAFASALCDGAGRCVASLCQVEQHLDKYKPTPSAEASADAVVARRLEAAPACVAAVRAEFHEHARAARPPVAEKVVPTEWVYGWLKATGLEEHADAFIQQGLKERADFTLEPRLTVNDLAKIGVDKAGEARRLLQMISEL